jgi:hypothetical protein
MVGVDCIKEDGESKDLADETIPGKRYAAARMHGVFR